MIEILYQKPQSHLNNMLICDENADIDTYSWWRRRLHMLVKIAWVFTNLVYGIPTYFGIILAVLPIRFIRPALHWVIEGRVFKCLLRHVSYWIWFDGYQIFEHGDDVAAMGDERCLVLVNHQGTADVPVLMGVFQRMGRACEKVYWIMDKIFLYAPFGWVACYHGDHFITQGSSCKNVELAKLEEQICSKYWSRGRRWIVLFPEGGLLHKRREGSQRFALKKGIPVLHRVSLPRSGALNSILRVTGPDATTMDLVRNGYSKDQLQSQWRRDYAIHYVLDCTIAYEKTQRRELWQFMFGNRPPCRIHIHWRVRPVEDLLLEATERVDKDVVLSDTALLRCWQRKEELLEHFSKHGRFPAEEDVSCEGDRGTTVVSKLKSPLILSHTWFDVIGVNIFLFLVFLVEFCAIRKVWTILWPYLGAVFRAIVQMPTAFA